MEGQTNVQATQTIQCRIQVSGASTLGWEAAKGQQTISELAGKHGVGCPRAPALAQVKYEDIYLKDYASVLELEVGLATYFHFYNEERPHQSLAYLTPAEVHFA